MYSRIWHYWEATILCPKGSGQRRLEVDQDWGMGGLGGGGGELAVLHFATLLPNFICWGYIRHSQIWHYWEATTLCPTGSGQKRGWRGTGGCGWDGDWQWQCSDVAQRCPRAYRGWCGGGGGRGGVRRERQDLAWQPEEPSRQDLGPGLPRAASQITSKLGQHC